MVNEVLNKDRVSPRSTWNQQLKLITQRNGAMKTKIFSVFLLKQT